MNTERKGWLKRLVFFLKLLEIRLRFVVILVLIAAVVGYWGTIQNYYERWTRSKPGDMAEHAHSDSEFFCPMHPFVVRETPAKCPICGMDLITRKKGANVVLPEGTISRVQVSPERIMQAGVQVEPVAYRLLANTVQSYGTVETDETRVTRVIARFPGRVEELIVNATGISVNKNDPLVKIYSPKYLAATLEYIQAVESKKQLDADPKASAEAKQSAADLALITRKPLERQGFTKEQLDEIERTGKTSDRVTLHSPASGIVLEKNVVQGDAVEEGTILYTVADLSTVWVQAQVVESEFAGIKIGTPVEVSAVARSGDNFYGTVDLIYPTVNSENRSVKVRVAVNNKEGKLKPGMYVTALIRTPLGRFGEIGSPSEPKPEAVPLTTDSAKKPAVDESYPLDTCPVTGEKLGEMGDPVIVEVEGRKVKLCCPACKKKVDADPKKYLAVLDEAIRKKSAEASTSAQARWAEGFTCSMHPDVLQPQAGPCPICNCGMTLTKWRVERVLSIPETAVIDTGKKHVVYVEVMPGVYDAKSVKLGQRTGMYYPVTGGLALGAKIVTRGSFLIDAEARLNPSNTAE